MFDCSDLPDQNEDLCEVKVVLPYLPENSSTGSPVAIGDVLAYLSLEAPGGESLRPEDLTFQRTVDLGDARYWIWSFHEPEGDERAYVTVRVDLDGTTTTSYDADYYGLSPEQFVVGDYCGCW